MDAFWMWATSIRLFLLRRGHYHCSTREIDPIEILVKALFDFMSTLEFRPRLINVRIAREMLEQYPYFFIRHLSVFLTGERERHNKVGRTGAAEVFSVSRC